jgi:hypothetical protein
VVIAMIHIDRAPPLVPPLPDESEAFRLALRDFIHSFAGRFLRGKSLGEAAVMLRVAATLLAEREPTS